MQLRCDGGPSLAPIFTLFIPLSDDRLALVFSVITFAFVLYLCSPFAYLFLRLLTAHTKFLFVSSLSTTLLFQTTGMWNTICLCFLTHLEFFFLFLLSLTLEAQSTVRCNSPINANWAPRIRQDIPSDVRPAAKMQLTENVRTNNKNFFAFWKYKMRSEGRYTIVQMVEKTPNLGPNPEVERHLHLLIQVALSKKLSVSLLSRKDMAISVTNTTLHGGLRWKTAVSTNSVLPTPVKRFEK